jgi:hypothetical protein
MPDLYVLWEPQLGHCILFKKRERQLVFVSFSSRFNVNISAHACSEIGEKWFLVFFRGFSSVLNLAHVHNFSVATLLFRNPKAELKPFLTILGTRMRALAPPQSPLLSLRSF